MNVYAVLILAALIVEFVVGLVCDLLNLRALRPEVPEEFAGVYDRERYARSQEYTRARTRFGRWAGAFQLATLLVFWFAGGFAWLDRLTRGLELGPIATGLVFIGALALGRAVLDLPWRWYSTFVIEEHFGFNKTTPRTFVLDVLKELALVVVLGGPLLAAVLWFFAAAGGWAWVLCWALTALFVVFVQFIAPAWILPLFHEFRPLEAGELKDAVLGYARANAFPLQDLYVVDGSRRSTKANAFFTGFGRKKRVALYDTLVEKHDTDELVAILAHEIGHYKLHHVPLRMGLGIAQSGVVFFLLSVFLSHRGLYEAFGVQEPSVAAGLVFFGLLFAPIDMVLSFFAQAFSRKHEYEADAFARRTTGGGESLGRALRRLAADSLENLTPHPWYVKLHYSHPPMVERLEALRAG